MRILDRYVGAALVRSYVAVVLVLVPLFSLLVLVEELDDVGRGRYEVVDALVFVALTAPGRAVELTPVCALLGGLIALGGLAQSNELLAMRAAGVSTARLAGSALRAGLPLVLAVAVLGEFGAPRLDRSARTRRAIAISDAPAVETDRGFWFRDGARLARVGRIVEGRFPADVEVFAFDDAGALERVLEAGRAEVLDDGRWLLHDVRARLVEGGRIVTRDHQALYWTTSLGESEIGLILRQPESCTVVELARHVRTRRRQGRDHRPYATALWRRLAMPLQAGAMVLLAVPFALGPLRSGRLGRRIAIGSLAGIAAWLFDRVVGHLGLVAGVTPAVTALAPVVLLTSAALLLLARAR